MNNEHIEQAEPVNVAWNCARVLLCFIFCFRWHNRRHSTRTHTYMFPDRFVHSMQYNLDFYDKVLSKEKMMTHAHKTFSIRTAMDAIVV